MSIRVDEKKKGFETDAEYLTQGSVLWQKKKERERKKKRKEKKRKAAVQEKVTDHAWDMRHWVSYSKRWGS